MPIQTEMLPCKLDDEEVRQKGESLAKLIARACKLEDERRQTSKQLNEQLNELRAEAESVAREISTRVEDRPVLVEERVDFSRRLAETVRLDTLEVLRNRHLTPEEAQLELVPDVRERARGKSAGTD